MDGFILVPFYKVISTFGLKLLLIRINKIYLIQTSNFL